MKRYSVVMLILLLVFAVGCTGTQKGAGVGT